MISAAARAAATVGVLCVAACSSDPGDGGDVQGTVVQLGAPGETNRVLDDDEIDNVEAPAYTDADVAFVQRMIPHHRQALEMTALVTERADSPDLPVLAERMDVSQRDEIEQLERWLTARGEALPDDDHGAHAESMPGMLSVAEMAELTAARGSEFDRLFLQYMIRHHEGAVVMVDELLSGIGGQESEIFQLAQHIDADQAVEIARMKRLLTDL